MTDRQQLNKYAVEYITRYQNLKIYRQLVNTPYYINNLGMFVFGKLLESSEITEDQKKKVLNTYKNREVPYGWYRGKGTPDQLEKAVLVISEEVGVSLKYATSYGVTEFMKLYGLGVDCSGFVFNVLYYAFGKINLVQEFMQSLSWVNPDKQGVNYAGAFTFASEAIFVVPSIDIQPMDLILIKSKGVYNHIALIVESKGGLQLAQSNLDSIPNGVSLSQVSINGASIQFAFEPQIATDWNTYIKKGVLEVRRFNFLN